MSPKSPKSSKNYLFLTYISLNIGHSDLIFCMQIDIHNTINNYHTQRMQDQKWQNMPPESSKISKNDLALTYISLNISHSDPIFCMQIDIHNTINNYNT